MHCTQLLCAAASAALSSHWRPRCPRRGETSAEGCRHASGVSVPERPRSHSSRNSLPANGLEQRLICRFHQHSTRTLARVAQILHRTIQSSTNQLWHLGNHECSASPLSGHSLALRAVVTGRVVQRARCAVRKAWSPTSRGARLMAHGSRMHGKTEYAVNGQRQHSGSGSTSLPVLSLPSIPASCAYLAADSRSAFSSSSACIPAAAKTRENREAEYNGGARPCAPSVDGASGGTHITILAAGSTWTRMGVCSPADRHRYIDLRRDGGCT